MANSEPRAHLAGFRSLADESEAPATESELGGALPTRIGDEPPNKRARQVDGDGGVLSEMDAEPTLKKQRDNEPQKARANEPRETSTKLYWIDVSATDQDKWTARQVESAAAITPEDVSACIALQLTEIAYKKQGFPESFAQSGVTYTDDTRKIVGIAAAFTSHAARATFIDETNGIVLVSPGKDCDDADAQVPYKIARNDSTPEMAQALMRKESARLTVFMKYESDPVTPRMVNQAILEQCRGIIITSRARQNSITDAQGRPLKSIMGTKPEIHARVAKLTGTPFHLPRVFIINGKPLRYKVEQSYFSNLCPTCHQTFCECAEIKAEVERTLQWKKDIRSKQRAYKQNKTDSSAGSSTAPQDVRASLLASRGSKGKEVANKRTQHQRTTLCRDFPKGTCKYGDRCAFSHSIPECTHYSCDKRKAIYNVRKQTHHYSYTHLYKIKYSTHARTSIHATNEYRRNNLYINTHSNCGVRHHSLRIRSLTIVYTHTRNSNYDHMRGETRLHLTPPIAAFSPLPLPSSRNGQCAKSQCAHSPPRPILITSQ